MKFKVIQHAEEKYLFGFSRAVWRTISLVIAVGVLISLMLTLWSVLPVAKRKVVKAEYPKEVEVSATDLSNFLNAKNDKNHIGSTSPDIIDNSNEFQVPDSITEPAADKLLLHKSLEKIRLVADELKASWEPIGEYYYPYGYDSYIYFRNEQTRQFIVKEPGLGNTLKTAFNRCNATTSIQKKALIDTLLYLVKAAPKAYRKPFLERVPEHFWSNSVDESIQKTDVFRRIILQQDTSKLKLVIEETANFLSRNPSDGLPFLLMADTLISKVDQDRRSQFLFSMMQGFSWWFDGKIEDQARITYSFVSRIKELGDTTPANRLLAFYYLYMEKNQKREASIDSIEVAYVEQTAIAESDYMIKKEKDKGRLRLALYGFGAGIITISLVALILVLLSIHKYIKQLTETIDKLIIENKVKL